MTDTKHYIANHLKRLREELGNLPPSEISSGLSSILSGVISASIEHEIAVLDHEDRIDEIEVSLPRPARAPSASEDLAKLLRDMTESAAALREYDQRLDTSVREMMAKEFDRAREALAATGREPIQTHADLIAHLSNQLLERTEGHRLPTDTALPGGTEGGERG